MTGDGVSLRHKAGPALGGGGSSSVQEAEVVGNQRHQIKAQQWG